MSRFFAMLALWLAVIEGAARADEPLKVGVFAVDASPPIGSPMAYDPTREIVHPLSCRGVVLIGEGDPIVLCAVDWIGIGNDGHREFRRALAGAAGTGTVTPVERAYTACRGDRAEQTAVSNAASCPAGVA
jgi:hypothetical protein